MRNSQSRGFTLIELLVVIAIIGVLSAVVLASLNSGRQKGNDGAAKSAMNNARAQSELYYDARGNGNPGAGNYTNICVVGGSFNNVKNISSFVQSASDAVGTGNFALDQIGDTATTVCNSSAAQWAAQVPLSTGKFFCVDSEGRATTTYNTGNVASLITSTTDRRCI